MITRLLVWNLCVFLVTSEVFILTSLLIFNSLIIRYEFSIGGKTGGEFKVYTLVMTSFDRFLLNFLYIIEGSHLLY